MAITQTTITKAAGFGRSDVITQLEQGFTWLGWNGETRTGIVTGISNYSGGGDTNASATYPDVRQISSSGIGTGASFYITRAAGGTVDRVMANRPGYGYTDGEYVTISAEDIGGSGNGAVAIGITVLVAGNGSPISYGSTTSFYDSEKSGTYPWGVARHTIQENKKYGDTYWGFQVTAGTASAAYNLRISPGSGFYPWDTTNTSNKGNYYGNRFTGQATLDVPLYEITNSNFYNYDTTSVSTSYIQLTQALTSTNGHSYNLDLNIFRSSIDPNFAVFSYRQPTLSSTILSDNTFSTFFFHNFTTSLWDLDELFLGGVTFIEPTTGNTSIPEIRFRSMLGGNVYVSSSTYYSTNRCAEFGYIQTNSTSGTSADGYPTVFTEYQSSSYIHNKTDYQPKIYYRDNSRDSVPVGANSDFNAVIKGIPLSTQMIPCPYYLPDDFVLINFDYATPAANIQQGDTITISGSEVYTVISGSYNQTTRTRGILFCARTV